MNWSAFTRYCHKESGKDLLGLGIEVSNSTPEDIAQGGLKKGGIEIFIGSSGGAEV